MDHGGCGGRRRREEGRGNGDRRLGWVVGGERREKCQRGRKREDARAGSRVGGRQGRNGCVVFGCRHGGTQKCKWRMEKRLEKT